MDDQRKREENPQMRKTPLGGFKPESSGESFALPPPED
jgi:hypothetical protein